MEHPAISQLSISSQNGAKGLKSGWAGKWVAESGSEKIAS